MHKSHTWHCYFRKHDCVSLFKKRASNSKFDLGSDTFDSIIDFNDEDIH